MDFDNSISQFMETKTNTLMIQKRLLVVWLKYVDVSLVWTASSSATVIECILEPDSVQRVPDNFDASSSLVQKGGDCRMTCIWHFFERGWL